MALTDEELADEQEELAKMEDMRKGIKTFQLEGEITIDIPDNLEQQISAKKASIHEKNGGSISCIADAWF